MNLNKVLPLVGLGLVWGVAQGVYAVFRGNGFVELTMTLIQAACVGLGIYLIWKQRRSQKQK